MKCKYFAAIVFAAMLLLSLTACGKLPFLSKGGQGTSITENIDELVDIIPSADTSISPNADTAADDSWRAEFEKSLLENYGVKPDHYEELGNGVYQVYVEIDGKAVPYVAVDSATGDYHG